MLSWAMNDKNMIEIKKSHNSSSTKYSDILNLVINIDHKKELFNGKCVANILINLNSGTKHSHQILIEPKELDVIESYSFKSAP